MFISVRINLVLAPFLAFVGAYRADLSDSCDNNADVYSEIEEEFTVDLRQLRIKMNRSLHSDHRQWVGHKGDKDDLGSVDQYAAFYFLHIPKTGGDSLKDDFLKELSRRHKIESREGCASWRQFFHKDIKLITLLREPRAHVLSQYMHCRYCTSSEECKRHRNQVPDTFEKWVEAWVGFKHHPLRGLPFECFCPDNLLTVHLSCHSTSHVQGFKRTLSEEDLSLGLRSLHDIEHVGLLEYYQESVCLFHGQIHGKLPIYCNCKDKEAWASFPQHHHAHGVPAHSLANYSEAVLSAIDTFTSYDRLLYAIAKDRFKQALANIEQSFGQKVLCRE